MRGHHVKIDPPALVREADVDMRLLEEARSLLRETNTGSWRLADIYVELTEKGWKPGKIAAALKVPESKVRKFLDCAKDYPLKSSLVRNNRPLFWLVFSKKNSVSSDDGLGGVELDERRWTRDDFKRRDAVLKGRSVVANREKDEQLILWAKLNDRRVVIDRTGDWGNPFLFPEDGDRDQVCDNFAVYLKMKPSLLGRLPELQGQVLVCWCYPERCHGDHLAALANGRKK
jgi:hypothetical protein